MSPEIPRSRAPSIRDVARLAGVSHQTVSRVLNEHPSIRDETRDRVLRAMDTLNYVPNRAARALVTSRSRTIGVLARTVGEYGPTSSITAAQNEARDRGFLVTTTNIASSDPDAIVGGIRHLLDQHVEGIIVTASQVRVFDVLAGMGIGVPYVGLQSAERDPRAVDPAQFEGGRAATQHLIDLGHTEILHLAGPHDWIEADARMRGYLSAIVDADLRTHPPILGDWTADFGFRAGRELLRMRDFTAVFAANDHMAIGLIHACRDAGVDVPRDISVVGFDDIPLAAHVWPPLTTIHQDFEAIGRRAVSLLLDGGAAEPSALTVDTHLVARSSSGPVDPRFR